MQDKYAINTLKMNGVAAVNQANSGHPGIVLSAATMLHTIFTRHIKYDPLNPKWINRDRFILSAGHGSALLYAQLRLMGLISEKDLKNFRQANSLTPGHPEYGHTTGVEATTGPLGQGLAMAIGLATSEAHLNAKFPSEIDHYTYAIVGDGDLQEGVAYEAMSFAGQQKLSKLIVLHDSNDIQLDTAVNVINTESIKKRVEAQGWNYQLVKTNTVEAISEAITKAKSQSDKPSFIEVKTIIGEGSSKQGTTAVHGAPLGNDIEVLAQKLEWTEDDYFAVPNIVFQYYDQWKHNQNKLFQEWDKKKKTSKFDKFIKSWLEMNVNLGIAPDQATRNSVGTILTKLAKINDQMIGGSADLSVSTKVAGIDGDFGPENRKGKNILFGVREMAMAAIANGIALHSNLKPFVSTFLVFADYLKGAMRLSALMNLPVLYIFSHDSVFVGEDGPTHQPIEQIAMMRAMPNITLFRPADEKEVLGSFKWYFENSKPTVIVSSRQNLKTLENTDIDKVESGAYLLLKGKDTLKHWTLIATGSETAMAFNIAKELGLSCYSVPSYDLVKKPNWVKEFTISIEAQSTFGWNRLANYSIGIDTFGTSAPGEQAYQMMAMDHDSVKSKIFSIISKVEK
ncbi:transketolase [Mycoplasma testudineum]|uniref:transketolase n=1 Tax=Mycoplasma testudineum TaxID=244584 RepID=A0A4R6IDZ3_9MOLU|nr:transketolase [Mycoplasma testudineum]OYD26706.1 transketolase [Mycoplasma testudineum]TDO19837.1 transketolase [Mycoplasma testudineum]